uniref:Uncharacterized protein n=1 Tax=Nonomuraea gerenzanensis TaxID=93944 RepID=A0A1M4E3K5_9ACTN|nr:hypothetical protein BN4615_P2939 [Nonomuraea gerenzanensis]
MCPALLASSRTHNAATKREGSQARRGKPGRRRSRDRCQAKTDGASTARADTSPASFNSSVVHRYGNPRCAE